MMGVEQSARCITGRHSTIDLDLLSNSDISLKEIDGYVCGMCVCIGWWMRRSGLLVCQLRAACLSVGTRIVQPVSKSTELQRILNL